MITRLSGTRVLITGITGFIGSHLARRLVKEEAEVYGIDINSRNSWRIRDIQDKIIVSYIDISNTQHLGNEISNIKPQKVFHLASQVDVSRSYKVIDSTFDTNVRGTINLLRSLLDLDFDCLVNTGAAEEYGDNEAPFKEDMDPRPVSPYSAAKACQTMYCHMFQRVFNLPVVTLRPFLTYGPGQISDMFIPSLIMNTLRGKTFEMTAGEQTREFNYIDDIVDGFIRASITPAAIGNIINIGNGIELKVIDIVKLVMKLLPGSVMPKIGALDYRKGEQFHFFCSNSKARTLLNWHSRVELEEGLNRTIDWFKNNNDLVDTNPNNWLTG